MARINNKTMKLNNALTIMDAIRSHGPISRASLAANLDLTAAAVTNIVASLMQSGLLAEIGVEDTGKGRRPILLDVNAGLCYLLGVMITTDDCVVALFDFKLTLLAVCPFSADASITPDMLVEQIARSAESLMKDWKITREDVLGIGIAAPGPLDSASGVLINPPNFSLVQNFPICARIEERLGLPSCCDRETNVAALAECRLGMAAAYRTVFYLTLFGNSVGGSLVSGGKVIHGFCDGAGEVGHMLIDPNGPPCTCGLFGCLEAMIKGDALVSEAQTKIKTMQNFNLPVLGDVQQLTLDDIFRLSMQGLPLFVDIVDKAAQVVATALGNVVSLFSPELIVLGGASEMISPHFIELIRKYTHRRKYPPHACNVRIEATTLGATACAYGAASLALEVFQKALFGEKNNENT